MEVARTGRAYRRVTLLSCAFTLLAGALLPAAAVADTGPGTDKGTGEAAGASGPDRMRVLSWNIRHGGKDKGLGGAKNLPLLLDQVAALAPDVFFAVETYGSADAIRRTLTRRAGKGAYHAVQVTPGGHGQRKDNLWIFTRYPVDKAFPPQGKRQGSGDPRTDVRVSGFHTGGARVRLPGGTRVNLFDTWLSFSRPWIGNMVHENAKAAKAGKPLTHSRTAVAKGERGRQTPQLRTILKHRIPAMLDGDRSPVLLAGDFNTVAAADWTAKWADCPKRYGRDYPLRTTTLATDAGFRDTYREVNPNVCTHPGSTWSPLARHHRVTPERIDFIFAKGRQLRPTRSFTVADRLPSHPDGPFYSDHAAVVTDFTVTPD